MKKVLDTELEGAMAGIIEAEKTSQDAAAGVSTLLKELQDASGLKLCQNISKQDVAYREVK